MNYNFDEIVQRTGTHSLKYDGKARYFGTDDLLPLWVADMDFRTPDFIMNAIRQRASHEIMGYSLKPEGFVNSVTGWMDRRFGWAVKPEWISFTPGVVSALNFAVLAFTEPGDKVIVQPPVYFPFFTAVKDHQRKLALNQLKEVNGKYRMDLEGLESMIDERTRLLLLCNPHNPVGRVWGRDELSDLGRICKRHNIVILSDEIHSDLILQGHRHVPLASISEELADITVTCMAPSKTFNVAGLASSVAITSNSSLRKQFEQLPNSLHLSNGNLFGIVALEAAYRSGEVWLQQMLAYVEENVLLVESYCTEHIPEIKVIHPEGTYMIWLDCRVLREKVHDLKDFFYHRAKVGLNYGADFGAGGEGYMRINVGCPKSIVLQALNRIREALAKL